ncbi:Uncharacterised protein [Mycobacteroides abscessus subsp. abscessus]|nr:Uncharacterised protein [Mycobacteroides abscessus subsp. abscessus]
MALIPTNCWKIASQIPTQTSGCRPNEGPRKSDSLADDSRLTVSLISLTRSSGCCSPVTSCRMRAASSSRLCPTRYRGDSGISSARMPYTTAGMTPTRNIHRQASSPHHNVFIGSPPGAAC